MSFERDVTESGTLSHTFTFDDFGFSDEVIYDWFGQISYSGEAIQNTDYTVTIDVGTSSIKVTFDAIDDGEIENIEDAILTLTGYIEWIAPDPEGDTFYENILGELVKGRLEQVDINEMLTVSINSLPVPPEKEIFVIAGNDAPLFNVLADQVDGSEETVTAIAASLLQAGISVNIAENGDVTVTDVPDSFASTSFEYTVVDDLGAQSSATLTVTTAMLALTDPGTTLQLTEGESAPTFSFNLSEPIDQDITISASLGLGGWESDVELLTATLAAGQTSLDAELIRLLNDDERLAKHIQSDELSITATVGGQSVPIFLNGAPAAEQNFTIELTDRVTAGLEQSSLAEAFSQMKLVNKATKDLFNVMTTAETSLELSGARKIASDYAKKIGIVLDASKALANLSANMDNARTLTGDDRYAAEYNAMETFAVDLGDAAIKTLASKYGAAGLAAAGMWGLKLAGIVALPAAFPVVATVAVGWGLSVAYDEFAKDHVRGFLRDLFREAVDKDDYKQYRKEVDEANDNPDINPVLGSHDVDDTLVGTAAADFAFLGSGNDSYSTGGGNDVIASGLGQDLVILGFGANTLIGTVGEHDGDMVEGFSTDDQIIIRDVALTRDDITVTEGSAILGIDSNGDDSEDGVITLEGTFTDGEFVVTNDGSDTTVTFITDPPIGTPGPDVLVGTGADDTIDALGSDDVIVGSTGDDMIDGGDGDDTVIYALDRSMIEHLLNPDGSISINKPGGESDELQHIERIDLDDGSLLYDVDTPNLGFGYRIYQASFDRTPDEGGVLFWIGVLDDFDNQGWSQYDKEQFLATQFIQSDEFKALFGANPTNEEYIDAMYQNVLDRLPDQGGYDFWVGGMVNDGLTREDILIAFTKSDENVDRTAPDLDDGVWVV